MLAPALCILPRGPVHIPAPAPPIKAPSSHRTLFLPGPPASSPKLSTTTAAGALRAPCACCRASATSPSPAGAALAAGGRGRGPPASPSAGDGTELPPAAPALRLCHEILKSSKQEARKLLALLPWPAAELLGSVDPILLPGAWEGGAEDRKSSFIRLLHPAPPAPFCAPASRAPPSACLVGAPQHRAPPVPGRSLHPNTLGVSLSGECTLVLWGTPCPQQAIAPCSKPAHPASRCTLTLWGTPMHPGAHCTPAFWGTPCTQPGSAPPPSPAAQDSR